MVIKRTEDISITGYQQKMLECNRLMHLLPANTRSVNGEEFIYYDITSKLTLRQVYGSRNLDMDDIDSLMKSIREACEEIDRYLLDVGRLCMDPDMIFYNCADNKYSFLYNLSTSIEDISGGLASLMDYLLERVLPEDTKANDMVYRIYDYYEKGGGDIWDILMMFDAGGSEDNEVKAEPAPKKMISPAETEINPVVYDSIYDGRDDTDIYVEREEKGQKESEGSLINRLFPTAVLMAGIIGTIACIGIYFFLYLNDDEKLLLIGAFLLSVIVTAAGAVFVIRRRIGKTGPKRSEISGDIYEVPEPAYVQRQMPDVHMDDFVAKQATRVERHHSSGNMQNSQNHDVNNAVEEAQTVFFDDHADSGNYKLYALDRKNKQHIELDHFPCTIGKLAGYVDCCIDHPSVSRLHARVEKVDDQLILSDLNSTNGVYLNGIRLHPNEQRMIETGDEIRIGSLNYCLRYSGLDA